MIPEFVREFGSDAVVFGSGLYTCHALQLAELAGGDPRMAEVLSEE